MGCASSTPMIQTTGSEMLKAATHATADATKTAEDAVEGIKDSVGKTLETAKDSVAATVESVKHEVGNVVKEKVEMVEDAKNSLMEKLHLKQTENEGNGDSSNKNEETINKADMDELKTQLNESVNSNIVANHSLGQTEETKTIKETILKGTDSETDSLKTSTPEPEIEQAFSKSHDSKDDEDDNAPTPKPTLSELENLKAEFLNQPQLQHSEEIRMVSDTKLSNDPLMSVTHENNKTLDSSNMILLTTDTDTSKDNEPTTTTALTTNDIKSNIVHAPQISTEVIAKPLQVLTKTPTHLIPLTLATTAMETATAATIAPTKDICEKKKFYLPTASPILPTQQPAPLPHTPLHQGMAEKPNINKVNKKENKIANSTEQKRPRTTEWEKFADMLAQMRKYNPHDAFRRGGTLTKFGGGGIGQLRERAVLGHHMRNGMDDDSSDTNSNLHDSPLHSKRSSTRVVSRVQHVRSRPNTGNNSKNYHESSKHSIGGNYAYKPRSNSNVGTTTGRKFDFNPARSRVNEFVSSPSLIQISLQNTEPTQMPSAPYSHSNESVKSPAKMRSYHSRNETVTLPPLEVVKRTRSHSGKEITAQIHHHRHEHQHQHQQHPRHDYIPSGFDHNSSSSSLQNDLSNNETPVLTRQSSNTSLFSNSSCEDNLQTFKSSTSNVRRLPVSHPPVKNSSSFLATPRCTSFGLTKSYTDLYFCTTSNKENKPNTSSMLYSKDKSPYRERKINVVCYKNTG